MRQTLRWGFTLLILIGSLMGASAREVIRLDHDWRFHFSHENEADRARVVSLPHTWNGDALAGIYPYLRTQGHYTRELFIPEKWSSKRLFLRFEGVERRAEIFVNGCFAGAHTGGGVAFCIEISDYVKPGAKNVVMVAVSNTPSNDCMPISSEENHYGGITRPVELLITDQVAVSPLYLGSEGLFVTTTQLGVEQAEGEIELHVSCPKPQNVEVSVTAYDPEGNHCFTQRRTLKSSYQFGQAVRIPFLISWPQAWSPEEPALYRFVATVRGEESYDEVTITSGLRMLSLDAERGFCLNGEPLKIRGLALAYDHPAEGPMLSVETLKQDLALAREVGANALLSPAAPHAQALYELCDSEGFLARIDLPFRRTRYLSDIYYCASATFEEQGVQLLNEMIAQHRNHPSVVMWGISCDLKIQDSRLEAYLKQLHATAQKADPTRPTVATSDQDGPANFIPQGIIWHQRLGWSRGQAEDIGLWLNQMRERWSHLASAIHYGAEGFCNQQPDHYDRPRPEEHLLPERRQSRFHEEYLRQLAGDSLLWGCWVESLSDFGSARRSGGVNGSGLVSFDRKELKDVFWLYRARWNKALRTLHIADKRWRERPDEPQQLTLYLSDGEQEPLMLHNSDTVKLEYFAPNIYRSEAFLLDSVSRIVVRSGELCDSLTIRCGCALKSPAKRAPLQIIGLPHLN